MSWSPISLAPLQYQNEAADGTFASGYVLKAYAAGTTTNIPMATDNTGSTTFNDIVLNASGRPEHSGAEVIPHIDQNYKLSLFATQAAADANTPAVWSIDNLKPSASASAITVTDATNSGVTGVLSVEHQTTGVPAAGIGAGILFKTETASNNVEEGASIEAVTTDVSDASEDFDLVFKVMTGGATRAEVARFNSSTLILNTARGLTAGTTQTQGGATAMTASINEFSTVANTDDGGALPSDTGIGERVMVVNNGANALKVWPATGDNINSGAANAADTETIAAGGYRIYTRQTATKWSYSVSTDAVNSFTASGAITAGDPVALVSDNTVKTITDATTATSVGTETVFEAAATANIWAAFDEASGKIVVAYADAGNSNAGTAVVGTVSGSGITFGTPVVFEAGATQDAMNICYDSVNEKVVIAFADGGASSFGKAIVGTVSGTSISFGTAATFESASTANTPIGICFDSVNEKVVIGYRDSGNSNRGTAVVGTVSGTSISFGTPATFDTATNSYVSCAYDKQSGKIAIAYTESTSGFVSIGTVSGTSISFGTRVNFDNAVSDDVRIVYHEGEGKVVVTWKEQTSNDIKSRAGTVSGTTVTFGDEATVLTGTALDPTLGYDSIREKLLVAYSDSDDSNHGKVIVGTLDGTSLTWGSPTDFASADTDDPAIVFDSSNAKFVVLFEDAANSSHGTGVVVTPEDFSAPLRSFIGLAVSTVADTESVDVTTLGGINTSQSDLLAGADFYLKQDGTYTTLDPGGIRPVITGHSATEALITANR